MKLPLQNDPEVFGTLQELILHTSLETALQTKTHSAKSLTKDRAVCVTAGEGKSTGETKWNSRTDPAWHGSNAGRTVHHS